MGRYIGIVGRNCAGKDTVAEILESLGFQHRSLSRSIRDEATARGMSQDREGLIAIANEWREREGPAVLAKKTIEKIGDGDWVVSSIRHPGEVEVLKSLPGFILWSVQSPAELRLERANNRGREAPLSLEQLNALDAKEDQKSGDAVQRIGDVEAMADIRIINDGTLDELREKVEGLL